MHFRRVFDCNTNWGTHRVLDMVNMQTKINRVRTQHRKNMFLCTALSIISISFIGTPLVFSSLSKEFKRTFYLIGISTSVLQLAVAQSSKENSGLKKAYDKYIQQIVSAEINQAVSTEKTLSQLEYITNTANIVETFPEYKLPRLIYEFNLQGLVDTKSVQQSDKSTALPPASSTVKVRECLPVFDQKVESLLDIDWVNYNLFFNNGIVFGNPGDGKSDFLAMIALNILAITPDADLKILDIHYDPEEPRFPGMPSNIEQSYFISSAKQIYNQVQNAYLKVIDRRERKDRGQPPIILIIDEYMALCNQLGKEKTEELNRMINIIRIEGRKYAKKLPNGQDTGCRVWCGMHSLKKGETGMDSGFMNSSHVFYLGNTVEDRNNPFPSSFNAKSLAASKQHLDHLLEENNLKFPKEPHKDKARTAIVQLHNSKPEAKVIPKFDLTKINYQNLENVEVNETPNNTPDHTDTGNKSKAINFPGDSPGEQLVNWYIGNEGKLTDKEILDEIFDLTGKPGNEQTVAKIRELGESYES